MSFKDNFKTFISRQVDAAVELVVGSVHDYAMTTSGDITPEQQEKLDEIKSSLKELIEQQTIQNLTEEQIEDYKLGDDSVFEWDLPSNLEPAAEEETRIWMVPVCRTGWGSRTIEVLAKTEQEAIELAIDAAGSESFSENDAEYSAPDGAHLWNSKL